MSKRRLLKLAQEQLSIKAPEGVCFSTVDTPAERREHAWHLGVRVKGEPAHPYALYEALAEAEETLSEQIGVEVLFHLQDWDSTPEDFPDHPTEQ